jgi:hypothetical protein
VPRHLILPDDWQLGCQHETRPRGLKIAHHMRSCAISGSLTTCVSISFIRAVGIELVTVEQILGRRCHCAYRTDARVGTPTAMRGLEEEADGPTPPASLGCIRSHATSTSP